MKEIELTPYETGELEDPVADALEQRGAIHKDEFGIYHLSKEHAFTYHEVLMLCTNDVFVGKLE